MLEILIAYIKATFENSMPNITEVQGLAEKITEGDTQFPALYCTGGEYKHLSALENYLYFRQTGSATEEESEEESTSGCAYMIRRTYPMVAVAYIPKSVYNTDNAFIDGKIAQNIANIITKANWQSLGVTLKTENIYAEVGEINTNRHEVWASEYRGVEFAARLDHVFVSVEFDIVVEASETCLQNYDCNDIEVEVNGDTILVEVTDTNAWHQTGDAIAGVKKLGSTTNVNWQIIHGGVVVATIQADGVRLNVLNAKATPGTIFLTTENGVIKSRTAAEVRADIGAGTVASVGLIAGSSGTDVNITGSPVTGSGSITINIPDASATARGLVTTGAQTFEGEKTFLKEIAHIEGLSKVVIRPWVTVPDDSAIYMGNITPSISNYTILVNAAQTQTFVNGRVELNLMVNNILRGRFTSGGLAVGNGILHASARLQVDDTTRGFLPSRVTTAQKNAIVSPAAGLIVFDTTLNKLCLFTTTWETITSS